MKLPDPFSAAQLQVAGVPIYSTVLPMSHQQAQVAVNNGPVLLLTRIVCVSTYRSFFTRKMNEFMLTLYQPMTHRCVMTFVNSP